MGKGGKGRGVIGVRAGQISTMNDSHVGRSERLFLEVNPILSIIYRQASLVGWYYNKFLN